MLGNARDESEIMTQILALKHDPVGFALYSYPWGEKGGPFEHLKGPRDWQLEELDAIGRHVRSQADKHELGLPLDIWRSAYSSGRGPGKTAVFGMLAHWHMSTHIGATTTVTANTETQMRTKTFPEFAVWFGSAINAHWFTVETMRIIPAPWILELARKPRSEGGLGIDPRYWFVQGQTWSEDNPNSFAGTHNPRGLMLLMDEASGIHHGVWDVSEGFFTEVNPYRFWLAASQMRSRQGRFHDIFYDEKQSLGWRARTISTRGMPGVDQNVIKDQIARYGEDSDFVRVEIDGLPPRTSEDQFIPWDNVRAAQRNNLGHDYGEPLILGVDPAPRGKTSYFFRQGRNARDCCGPSTSGSWAGYDNVQIAAAVLALDQKFRPDAICIDFGMGTGVIDILKRKRTYGRLHEVRFGANPDDKTSEFATHAIELWDRVKSWLVGGMLETDDGTKGTLSHQLTDRGWRWSGKEDGKKILETKDDLKRRGVDSPDDADALACTFEVNPPRRDHVRGSGRGPIIADGADSGMFGD